MTHLGFEDLSGQLHAALDQFAGATRVEFAWVAVLLVAYLILIGPADYLLVRKLGRMHWTWISFPLVVLLFGALAVVLADRWRGTELRVNQVDVVDVDWSSGLARGSTWAHLYSPSTQSFNLDCRAGWPVVPSSVRGPGTLFSWQGLPGRGLGGLDTQAAALHEREPYTIASRAARANRRLNEAGERRGVSPPVARGAGAETKAGDSRAGDHAILPQAAGGTTDEIRGLPIPVAGSKSLTARSWAGLALDRPPRLSTDAHGLLNGEVFNPLTVGLSDVMVLYENWVYVIAGDWEPGQRVSLDGRAPRNLQWRLTRRKVVDSKDVSTPWDRASFDVPRIVEIMMFHKAAGGESYTDLTSRYQSYLDLSDHLRSGRAIIVGRGAAPACQLRRDEQSLAPDAERPFSFYRIVIPVEKG